MVRSKYLEQLRYGNDLHVELLHAIAQEIADGCGHSLFKAHRLAWGWTVAEAVERFHQMCRRDKLKPRGLVVRSWMEWEAGGRPSFDYQDLLCRLFRTNPVQLGWAVDYAPTSVTGPQSIPHDDQAFSSVGWQSGRALMQLPPDTNDFTGRTEQIAHLITVLGAHSGTAVPIATISGKAGVGKTALAIHVAHRVSDAFPDGQLYANLRGAEAKPLEPSEIIAGFLRELGVDGADIPEDVDERARRYRACLAGRRILVVLDNAVDETQLRPLLPGASSCAVLITSRSHLAALSGAQTVHLDVLERDRAVDLITTLVGAERSAAESETVAEVARLCGYLPLALRIAGARLMSRPSWSIAWLAERLADETRRLDLLKVGDLEVRASFALSYRSRSAEEQRAFRALALTAATFPAWNVAALLDTDLDDAEYLLENLVDAQLVELAGVDPTGLIRYRLHDLIRDFARECSTAFDNAEERRSAADRLVDEYTRAMQIATAKVHPGTRQDDLGEILTLSGIERADPRRWFAAEQANLVAAVELSHNLEIWERTWRLVETLPAMFDWRADWQAWAHTHRLALDAARKIADERAEAVTLRCLGVLYRELGRYDEATEMLTQAAEIFHRLGDRPLWATTMRNLGDTRRYQGRLDEAIASFSDALEIVEAEDDSRSIAGVLNGIADASRGLSRWDEASRHFESSLAIYRTLNDHLEEARTLVRYGLVRRDRWNNDRALSMFEQALQVFRDLDDQRWQARALRHIAVVHRNETDFTEAHAAFDQCLALFDSLADRRGTAVTLRNRGDAHRLADDPVQAATDLGNAREIFEAIADHRWTARTQLSLADLHRTSREWDLAQQEAGAALETFQRIGDRPAQARTLRQIGLLHRDISDFETATTALAAAQAIFSDLGDDLWLARVHASQARLVECRGEDPAPAMDIAETICRSLGITAKHRIETVLKEW
ncbi:ATP-binding protein [Nocardia wallacei]|uniref:ATP-binding protein n=1 Tax=Nocardia wallacei TaxID=480035 RepID=UPI002456810F|nr:tetratricopeptide repeat protein [Nocardia wallacei]